LIMHDPHLKQNKAVETLVDKLTGMIPKWDHLVGRLSSTRASVNLRRQSSAIHINMRLNRANVKSRSIAPLRNLPVCTPLYLRAQDLFPKWSLHLKKPRCR
jgi:hypothetical protein